MDARIVFLIEDSFPKEVEDPRRAAEKFLEMLRSSGIQITTEDRLKKLRHYLAETLADMVNESEANFKSKLARDDFLEGLGEVMEELEFDDYFF